MTSWEIILIGVALSMDAFAVGLTDGIAEPFMSAFKTLIIALAFALFQFFMPVIGYYLGAAFTEVVSTIAPYLSFALLAFLGGKAIADYAVERIRMRKNHYLRPVLSAPRRPLGAIKLLVQAVATSLDALAVGVTLYAAETSAGLPFPFLLCALIIGVTTFSLSVIAVSLGKKAGGSLSDNAEVFGGAILIAVGLKILLEGVL